MISLLHTFLAINIFFNSLVLHELGHFFYFKWFLKKDVEIRIMRANKGFNILIGYPLDYIGLTTKQLYLSYVAGIFAGLIFLLGIFCWNIIYGLLIPPYIVCCVPDIKNIWRIVKNDRIQKANQIPQ